MQKKRVTPEGKNTKIFIIAAVIVVVLSVLAGTAVIWNGNRKEKEKIKKGITYLESLEKQDVSAISKKIDAISAELNQSLAETDESAVWAGFGDAMILGDSRAVGFSFHEFILEERVLAQGGGKITDISEMPAYLEQIKRVNPKKIFLCFGLNDVGIGFWPEATNYAAVYAEQVEILKKELPDSIVYINSILPAVGVGLEADPDYPRIGEYNEALKSMAAERGYQYIDNGRVCEEHQDLYQPDGLHVEKEFYKYWAANMLAGVKEE